MPYTQVPQGPLRDKYLGSIIRSIVYITIVTFLENLVITNVSKCITNFYAI